MMSSYATTLCLILQGTHHAFESYARYAHTAPFLRRPAPVTRPSCVTSYAIGVSGPPCLIFYVQIFAVPIIPLRAVYQRVAATSSYIRIHGVAAICLPSISGCRRCVVCARVQSPCCTSACFSRRSCLRHPCPLPSALSHRPLAPTPISTPFHGPSPNLRSLCVLSTSPDCAGPLRPVLYCLPIYPRIRFPMPATLHSDLDEGQVPCSHH
jgi:hypothetical protein